MKARSAASARSQLRGSGKILWMKARISSRGLLRKLISAAEWTQVPKFGKVPVMEDENEMTWLRTNALHSFEIRSLLSLRAFLGLRKIPVA